MLQQLLEVWAVHRGQAYDVFEVPPHLTSSERTAIENELVKYPYIVSTMPWKGAFVIGEGTTGQIITLSTASKIQQTYDIELTKRGW